MKITALLPAYNEEDRVGDVINALKKNKYVDNIVVVDDGSEDNTALIAKKAGARVIEMKQNKGKGAAIQKGIKKLDSDIALMLDADLIGLTTHHIQILIEPLLEDEADMVVGVLKEGRGLTDLAQLVTPNLSGQRAVKLDIIKDLNDIDNEGFGVEITLNKYVRDNGRLKFVDLPGLTHVMKEEKMGFIKGVRARLKMYGDIIKAVNDRYIMRNKN